MRFPSQVSGDDDGLVMVMVTVASALKQLSLGREPKLQCCLFSLFLSFLIFLFLSFVCAMYICVIVPVSLC